MKCYRISFQVSQVASAMFLRCTEQSNALKHSLLASQKPSIRSSTYHRHPSVTESTSHRVLQTRKPRSLFSSNSQRQSNTNFIFSVFSSFIIII